MHMPMRVAAAPAAGGEGATTMYSAACGCDADAAGHHGGKTAADDPAPDVCRRCGHGTVVIHTENCFITADSLTVET